MKLSTKGRYGLKAMVDLAVAYESNEYVSASSLAKSQGISEAYLERLIGTLKGAGCIESVRGAFGGYRLSRCPEKITVGEVLKALEGSTTLAECVDGGTMHSCENACSCSARPLWLKLQSKIDEVLNTTTLKDMADDYIAQIKFMESKSKRNGDEH